MAILSANGRPAKLRIYDNGGASVDRYTVVFTGNYKGRGGRCSYLAMSGSPFHPQGFCQHGEHHTVIDRPQYSHLGKPIGFDDLPEDCQKAIWRDYREIWNLKG